jgi:hypothetical protein
MQSYTQMNLDEWHRYRDLVVDLRGQASWESWRDALYLEADRARVNVLDRSAPSEWLAEALAWQLQKGRVTVAEVRGLPAWVQALPDVAAWLGDQNE